MAKKRALTTANVLDQKHSTFSFRGVWAKVFGEMSTAGVVIIQGAEKNGKTWFALMFAKMLSSIEKVVYVSAEEGYEKEFCDAIIRAGIDRGNKAILWEEFRPLDELEEKMNARRAARIWFIDNATVYDEYFARGQFLAFKKRHLDKLIVVVAHEERGEPFPACAKAVRRFAKVIVRVKGLTCFVSGRCPGGTIAIHEEKAQLYHGNEILTQ